MKLSFASHVLLTVCIVRVFFIIYVRDIVIFHTVFGLNEGIDDSGETPYSAVLRGTAGVPAPSVW